MHKRLLILIACLLSINTYAQRKNIAKNNLLEINGVVMSSDSLLYIPYVIINRISYQDGTIANHEGVFSMIVNPGDTLEFLARGYGTKYYIIPTNLTESRYSIIQLMSQDTFYLDETIIAKAPTREEFDNAFKNWDIPSDQLEIARRNTDKNTLAILAETMAKDGDERQTYYIQQQWQRTTWLGGTPPQKIFSPLAWAEFIDAWKSGKFKKRKK
jgi:hypothetical protein